MKAKKKLPDQSDQPLEPGKTPYETDGPSFVVISLTGDTDPVTEATTVNFAATMSQTGDPDLILGFYEVQQSSSSSLNMVPITVSPLPTITWNNGVASFSLVMDSDIFDQLSSPQTNFAVTAQIDGTSSYGIDTFGIDLSE